MMKILSWLIDYSMLLVPVMAVVALIFLLLERPAATPAAQPITAVSSDDPTAPMRAWLGNDLPSSRLRNPK